MKLRNSLISISLASLLAGCGSSSDSGNSTSSSSSSSSSGSSGSASVICIDTNKNAICDAGEQSEEVNAWDRESAVATTLTGGTLAYNGENGYIFTAPAGSPQIYPGTTLLNNELIYNQLIDTKTKPAARTYMMSKFGGSEPTTENKRDMADAFKTNINAHPTKSRYAVIAAVVNKIVADTSDIANITVTAAEVDAANVPSLAKLALTKSLDKNVTAEIDQQVADGWVDSNDASIRYIDANGGKAVGGSIYHNALTIIDASTQTAVYTPVGTITDHGHNVDSVSGASEPYVRGVILNSDASFVYVNIRKGSGDAVGTAGLYKAKIEADGSIATVTTELDPGDGQKIDIDTSGDSTKLDKYVQSFAVSSDDSKVAVYGGTNANDSSGKNLYIYSGDLSTKLVERGTDGLGAIAMSADTVFAVNDTNITKMSTSDLNSTGQIELDFEPSGLIINSDGTKLIAYDSSTKIAVINLADNSINTGEMAFGASTVSASDDFSKVVLVGRNETSMLIVNLTVAGFSVQGKYTLEDGSRGASFIGNDKVAVINSRNGMAVIDIATTNENNNLDSKIELAKETLNKDTINDGGDLSVIINNLSLSSGYENVGISWTSTLPTTNLNTTDGTVTRPTTDTQDAQGTLTASLAASFRDVTKTDTKVFPANIRKAPANLGIAKSTELGNRPDVIAVNQAENIVLASVRFDDLDDNNETRYGVSSFLVPADGNMTEATPPKVYHPKHAIVGLGISGENAVVIDSNGSTGNIFTVALAADGTMADAVTLNVGIVSGEPKRVDFNTDKTQVAVLIKKPDGKYITNLYATDTLTETNSITMGDHDYYASWKPLAMNDDGSRIYQRDSESNLRAFDGSGAEIASVEVGDWYLVLHAFDRVFAIVNNGTILSFNEDLGDKKQFSTGVGSYILGAGAGEKDGKNYLYFGSYGAAANIQGVYQLEVSDEGSLTEIAFSPQADRTYGIADVGNNDKLFFFLRGSDYKASVIKLP